MRPKDMKREHARRRSAYLRRRAFLYGGGATVIGALAAWQLWPTGRQPVAPECVGIIEQIEHCAAFFGCWPG